MKEQGMLDGWHEGGKEEQSEESNQWRNKIPYYPGVYHSNVIRPLF